MEFSKTYDKALKITIKQMLDRAWISIKVEIFDIRWSNSLKIINKAPSNIQTYFWAPGKTILIS